MLTRALQPLSLRIISLLGVNDRVVTIHLDLQMGDHLCMTEEQKAENGALWYSNCARFYWRQIRLLFKHIAREVDE